MNEDISVTLDGAYGEGGGQILRTALALSSLSGKAFSIDAIRKGRKKPGLKAQHLHCVKALEELSGAAAQNVVLGSPLVTFSPGSLQGRTLAVDIGTAGSITLLLQSLLLPCALAKEKVRLKITGGTDVLWSPSYDYFRETILPFYAPFADIKDKVLRRGFYPTGNGKIDLVIRPRHAQPGLEAPELLSELRNLVPPLDLSQQGTLLGIRGRSIASNALKKQEVAERQLRGARQVLRELDLPLDISCEYVDTKSIGTVITLWVQSSKGSTPCFLGADALGEKGKRAEIVGQEAAEKLLKEIQSDAAVDSHLADNLIPLLALQGGCIRTSSISEHTLTNIYTVEQFLNVRFKVTDTVIETL